MRWWAFVVVALGCDAGVPPEPARRRVLPERDVPEVKGASAAPAKPRFDAKLIEIAVDRPIYPVPHGFRPRKDAKAIEEDVQRTVERELDRIRGCINDDRPAAVGVSWTIAPGGRPVDVGAGASLTSPGQDDVRDKCIADVIRTVVFEPPGRAVPIQMALAINVDD